ncbi:MAG TPA: FkbM family methyltransferase [Candidatus Limnocylindrales bacterium]|nr:FkbM family methyltransferase [Candidatus Limnocylindrales bacterium]
MRALRRRVDRRIVLALRGRLARQATGPSSLGLEKIGSDYGGWIVPTALIDSDWVCYLAGVGEDITFDLALIERFRCAVFAFDPTPRAIAHVAATAADVPSFHFLPIGVWSEDTTLRFFAPRNPAHVSHSVVNLQRTSEFFEATVRSLPSVMAELGHARVDLLKLDIEGAEHEVVRSMVEAGIRPRVLCMEIDQPVRPIPFWRTVRRARRAGYRLVALDGWNLTFVGHELVDGAGRS